MGADYSFYVKTIETQARAFFKVITFSISSVNKKNLGLFSRKQAPSASALEIYKYLL